MVTQRGDSDTTTEQKPQWFADWEENQFKPFVKANAEDHENLERHILEALRTDVQQRDHIINERLEALEGQA